MAGLSRLSAVCAAARGLMTRLLPETRTVSQEAAPAGTIPAVLVVAILAALLIVPAFALFYTPEGSTS